jgi:hypothetical protein
MPDFHCNMLDEHGYPLFPADIVANDLEADPKRTRNGR